MTVNKQERKKPLHEVHTTAFINCENQLFLNKLHTGFKITISYTDDIVTNSKTRNVNLVTFNLTTAYKLSGHIMNLVNRTVGNLCNVQYISSRVRVYFHSGNLYFTCSH